jgi:hypothetical protein
MTESGTGIEEDLSYVPTIDLLDLKKSGKGGDDVLRELEKRRSVGYEAVKKEQKTSERNYLDIDYRSPNVQVVSQRKAVIVGPAKDVEEHDIRYIATYGLSSCVGLVLYDKNSKAGALAHTDGMTKTEDINNLF